MYQIQIVNEMKRSQENCLEFSLQLVVAIKQIINAESEKPKREGGLEMTF